MKIIYAHEPLVDLKNTIFLAGPTPRNAETKSWRPDFIQELNNVHFDGTVLVPEASDGIWKNDYIGQVKWESPAFRQGRMSNTDNDYSIIEEASFEAESVSTKNEYCS